MKIIGFITFLTVLLSSCAFHSGNISSGSTIDCPMRSIVTGHSSTNKILGLGGLSKSALILEAKQDLYNKHLKNKNIKLTNFTVDFKTTYLLIFSSKEVTVSADLFDCGEPLASNEEKYVPPIIDGLRMGDSIIYEYNGFIQGQLNNCISNRKCMITYKTKKGDFKRRKVDSRFLYQKSEHSDNKTYYEYNIGEKAFVEIYVLKTKTKTIKPCTIIGVNKTHAIISYIKDDGEERILSVDKSLIK